MKSLKCFLLVAFVCILCPFRASADQITLAADVWCPYNCEPDSANPGYMIEVARQVFRQAGHTVAYRNAEWEKAIEDTRKGRYTAIVGGSKSDAPDFVYPTKSLGVSQNIFFARKGTAWKYTGIESLKKVRLGVAEGYSYNDEIDRYVTASRGKSCVWKATGDTPLQECIDRLMKGEIDTFIEDPSVYGNYCGSKGLVKVLGAVQTAGQTGQAEKIYIAFSPANPKSKEYAALLSAGIEKMRKTGELKKILARYYVKDWE